MDISHANVRFRFHRFRRMRRRFSKILSYLREAPPNKNNFTLPQPSKFSSMCSKQTESDLLVFGFVKEGSQYVVPVAITKLIKLFYHDIIHWKISSVKLEKVMESTQISTTPGITSKVVKIINIGNDLKLQLQVYKNYYGRRSLRFGFGVRQFPSNIESIDLFIAVKCETLNKLIMCEMQNIQRKVTVQKTANLGGCDLIFYDDLTFNCSIDIKRIKYKAIKTSTM